MSAGLPAIELHEISKRYPATVDRQRRFRISWRRSDNPVTVDDIADEDEELEDEIEDDLADEPLPEHDTDIWALRDLSLEIQAGERVGIVGRAGCGKTTLTRLLTRVVMPTEGRILIRGHVNPLLRTVTGLMWPHSSARANVVHVARFLGVPAELAEARVPDILAFAAIESKAGGKISRLSPGELQRLGYAIGLHLDPDILVADEVIAVGDPGFQRQCIDFVRRRAEDGMTMVFASHDLETVRQLCDRAILLDEGQVAGRGGVDEVADLYQAVLAKEARDRRVAIGTRSGPAGPPGPRGPIESSAIFGPDGQPVNVLEANEAGIIEVRLRVPTSDRMILRCIVSLVGHESMVRVTQPTTFETHEPGLYVFSAPLPPGALWEDFYRANLSVFDYDSGNAESIGQVPDAFQIEVFGVAATTPSSGIRTRGPKRNLELAWDVVKASEENGTS